MKRMTVAVRSILIAIVSLAVAGTCFAAADDKNVKELIAVDDDWSNAAVARMSTAWRRSFSTPPTIPSKYGSVTDCVVAAGSRRSRAIPSVRSGSAFA